MQIPRFAVLDKKVGQTPLEALTSWKENNPEYAVIPATYAGRLDPMASGKLLILLGDECKKQENYRNLDKEYEVEIVLGLLTDTGDALGVPISAAESVVEKKDIEKALRSLTGAHTVPYPAFSSKTVNGKQLFQYALEGTLSEIEIPSHEENIYSISILGLETISAADLDSRITNHLSSVPRSDEPSKVLGADFRQDLIREKWTEALAGSDKSYSLLRVRVTSASGTYMRTLAKRLGTALGTNGFALSIHRSRIGKYISLLSWGFWRKEYR